MKKRPANRVVLKIIYDLVMLFSIVVWVFMLFCGDIVEFEKRKTVTPVLMTDCEITKTETENGIETTYEFNLPDGAGAGSVIAIYSMHQNVDVRIQDELIYSYYAGNNYFGKTGGCKWSLVHMKDRDNVRTVRVISKPVYENTADSPLMIYVGDEVSIFRQILKISLIEIVCGFFTVILGTIFIVLAFIYRIQGKDVEKLISLGTFAELFGWWKLSDMIAAGIFVGTNKGLALLPFLTLFALNIPFAQYVRTFFRDENKKIWDVGTYIACLTMLVCVIIQVANIKDLREIIWVDHLIIAMFFAMYLYCSAVEHIKYGVKKDNIVHMASTSFVMLGVTIDILTYYFFEGIMSFRFVAIGFLIYFALMGWYDTESITSEAEKGRLAEKFRKMALSDPLTGVYSRSAYEVDRNVSSEELKKTVVAIFDLNDLKYCNDHLGHEAGDKAIKEAANIITYTFSARGKCYRTGGDEFCVLMSDVSEEECNRLRERLHENCIKYNGSNPKEYPINIACGYAAYSDDDRLVADIVRRADRMMYENKAKLKAR